MKRNTIDIITLGCSKNLVDSEKLMRQLEANGYKVTHDSDKPQTICDGLPFRKISKRIGIGNSSSR